MKILFISAWYYPAKVGGVARMMHNLAKELVKHGHEVVVWTTDYLNGREKPIKKITKHFDVIDGVKVYYFKSYFHSLQARTKQTISLQLFKKVFSKEINNFDVIHLFETRSLSIAIIMIILMLKNKKNVFHSAYGALGKNNLSWKYKIYDKIILKPFFNRCCKLFFAQTIHEINVYKKFVSKKKYENIKLLPLATDVEKNLQMAQKYKGLLRKKIFLKKSDILYLYLGRLTKNKGIDLLLNSFFYSLQQRQDIKLAIVGYDEGMKKNIESFIKINNLSSKIFLLDPIYEERFGYYYDADVFIITSIFYEETSLASVEALSIGKPVIVTKQVELPYLNEYKAGFIVNDNVKDITDKILFFNKNNLNFFSKNAFTLSRKKYDIKNIIFKLINFYQEKENK